MTTYMRRVCKALLVNKQKNRFLILERIKYLIEYLHRIKNQSVEFQKKNEKKKYDQH